MRSGVEAHYGDGETVGWNLGGWSTKLRWHCAAACALQQTRRRAAMASVFHCVSGEACAAVRTAQRSGARQPSRRDRGRDAIMQSIQISNSSVLISVRWTGFPASDFVLRVASAAGERVCLRHLYVTRS